jgi:ubiquinone/menaquinone biosynthesis C-methylase UbiE
MHISYSPTRTLRQDKEMRVECLVTIVNKVLKGKGRVFDMACGTGELISSLTMNGYETSGMDIDAKCVEIASQHGKVSMGDYADLGEFNEGVFDLLVSSHSLEHLHEPLEDLKKLCRLSNQYVLLALPNPMSLENVVASLFRRILPVMPGHISVWDHRHLNNLVRTHAKLEPVFWSGDFVRCIPRRYGIRSALHKVGLVKIIEAKLMMKLIPFYSNSIVVLCKKK